ncbi:MAG: TerC family protein [Leptolyngbya sp. PLA3]|nr:MAG: TerC family protein [Cyanobacteria bacterium CYA]MCE7969009.1 TerC family protein [Leptolyngbya sp. PL-A3]
MLELLTLADAAASAPSQAVAFFSAAGIIALVTLASLEIVLGIDNVIFIAILTGRLPEEKQGNVRTIGLLLAMIMRLVLLALAWLVMKLQTPLFKLPFLTEHVLDPAANTMVEQPIGISGKDLVLLIGGLFLITKATYEIHHLVEGDHDHPGVKSKKVTSVGAILTQILVLDLVFSLDSVITAVGMTTNYWIMSSAVVIAVGVMLGFAGPIARFVSRHPSMKTLALAFLVLIGVLLVADGLHQHLGRGYVYFAMAFALIVELINIKAGARRAHQNQVHQATMP